MVEETASQRPNNRARADKVEENQLSPKLTLHKKKHIIANVLNLYYFICVAYALSQNWMMPYPGAIK